MPAHTPDPVPAFVPLAQMVQLTGAHHHTLINSVRAGRIPAVKIGNNWLVPVSFLHDLERTAYANLAEVAA
jgi:hypothetical protein